MAMMDRVVVFFDLETTGLDTSRCEILQLAAISDDRRFNVFISPCRDIDEGASRVNGFTTHGHGSDPRSLQLHGQPVDAVPPMRALADFIDFLSSFQAPLLLAAHNARAFDVVVLTRNLQRCSLMPRFLEVSGGWFLDTLQLSRELWSLKSHKLKDLVSHFLNMPFNAHDAQEDVRVLQELYMKWKPNQAVVQSCTFSPAGR